MKTFLLWNACLHALPTLRATALQMQQPEIKFKVFKCVKYIFDLCFDLTVETYNDMAFNDIFLHLLTGHLILLSDEFGSEDFCSAVFDGFLLTSFSRCVRQILSQLICPSKMTIFFRSFECIFRVHREVCYQEEHFCFIFFLLVIATQDSRS